MKSPRVLLSIIPLLTLPALMPQVATAQLKSVTFNLTGYLENPNYTRSYQTNQAIGIVTITQIVPAPARIKFTSKEILARLAVAENAAGNWSSNNFPSGATLAMNDSGDFVVAINATILLAVSNVISSSVNSAVTGWMEKDHYDLTSGGYDVQSLNRTTYAHRTINYDDSSIAEDGGLTFELTGMDREMDSDSWNSKTAIFIETHILADAAGGGTYKRNAIIITGSISAHGKETIHF